MICLTVSRTGTANKPTRRLLPMLFAADCLQKLLRGLCDQFSISLGLTQGRATSWISTNDYHTHDDLSFSLKALSQTFYHWRSCHQRFWYCCQIVLHGVKHRIHSLFATYHPLDWRTKAQCFGLIVSSSEIPNSKCLVGGLGWSAAMVCVGAPSDRQYGCTVLYLIPQRLPTPASDDHGVNQ